MNLDKRIKDELESEAKAIDEILNDKQGIYEMMIASFQGGMGIWMWIVNFVILIVTGLMLWCGYEFFTATASEEHIYWGFCMVIAVMGQIALKQWAWMEMNRTSLMREIKRVEIAVAKLSNQK